MMETTLMVMDVMLIVRSEITMVVQQLLLTKIQLQTLVLAPVQLDIIRIPQHLTLIHVLFATTHVPLALPQQLAIAVLLQATES
jgi:hypothetical protein